jgi:RND family efflux transporter MFP subunit
MRLRRIILRIGFIGLIMGGLLGGTLLLRQTTPDAQPATVMDLQTIPVTRGDVELTVVMPGQLLSSRQATLSFAVGGDLTDLKVQPGDEVKAGDLLASLDKKKYLQAVQAADLRVQEAQINYERNTRPPTPSEISAAREAVTAAELGITGARGAYTSTLYSDAADAKVRSAKLAFDMAVSYFQEVKADYEQRQVDQETYDTAMTMMINAEGAFTVAQQESQNALVTAQQNLTSAQQRYHAALASYQDVLRRASPEQSKALSLTLSLAQLDLVSAQTNLAATDLRAPFTGTVLNVRANENQIVGEGQPVITLVSLNDMEAVAQATETDLPEIQVGQRAEIHLTAWPSVEITGTVKRIAPAPSEENSNKVFKVWIEPGNTPSNIPSGVSLDVKLVIARREQVLFLPRSLLTSVSGDARAVVKILSKGQLEERTVQLGLQGDVNIEIVSGLTEGDQAVLP